MRRSGGLAIWNVLLWMSILVTSALFQSELGGGDSYYNAMTVVLIAVFILINRSFDRAMVMQFVLPIAFLTISVVSNTNTMQPGGYRSAVATALGYAIFALNPVPLSHSLLRRLTILYLVTVVALSIQVGVSRDAIDFGRDIANANFNVNPNSASMFFMGGVILALAVVRGIAGWVLASMLLILNLTTGSRAGALATVMVLLGFSLVGANAPGRQGWRLLGTFKNAWAMWLLVVVSSGLAIRYLPDAVDYLFLRFESGQTRADVWRAGWEEIETWRDFLIGRGPATLGSATGSSAHSAYLNAIGNSGIFFLVTTLIAFFAWLRKAVREGSRDMLWVLPAVLMVGAVEEILFNGVASLWLITMLTSVVAASKSAANRASPAFPMAATGIRYRPLPEGHPMRELARQR